MPRDNPFAYPSPHLFATIARLIGQAAADVGQQPLLERFPFLQGYLDALAGAAAPQRAEASGAPGVGTAGVGTPAVAAGVSPLEALREAADLDDRAVSLLMAIGLIEEDARFGPFFDEMQGATAHLHRPTVGLLNAWWREETDRGEVRASLRKLFEAGLLRVVNPEAPRLEQALEVVPVLWDALRGEVSGAPIAGAVHHPSGELLSATKMVLTSSLRADLARLPLLLERGEVEAVIVRGARHNGRRTLLGAVARACERGVLEVHGPLRPDDERWRILGPLATLSRSMPVLVLNPGLGETVEIPRLSAYRGPLGVVLGKQGGVSGPGVERGIVLDMPIPDEGARRTHWLAGLAGVPWEGLDSVVGGHRMTAGNIRRTAAIARSYSALADHGVVGPSDIRRAARAVHRQTLDALAARIDTDSSKEGLVVNEDTRSELDALFARCRHRESLRDHVGPLLRGQLNIGVRALFHGPSGTGKTLAAKSLAARLAMDLYRVDLSSVVSKYIGETEKNLGQIFSIAEELDVMLLFDEGDSLFAQRTSVQSSNDRYANLETNYLLQRVETFEGVVVITTNAAEHIDSAFQRRMDVIVDFPAPDAAERLSIWKVHLPSKPELPPAFLEHVATRCALTGGQIRNAVLHASLLALEAKRPITTSDVESAVVREYRRMGSMAPIDVE